MNLVQLLLPLYAPDGTRFPASHFEGVAHELTGRFGGLTAYARAPAEGLWQEHRGRTHHDEIVVYEVMVDDLDEGWWREYRSELQTRFRQRELVVRAQEIRRL